MMWPVAEFYHGSNRLAAEELRLADILRERGREDLARYIVEGRKVQRFQFALGPESESSSKETFTNLFMGLRRAFDQGDQAWDQWRSGALEKWEEDKLFQSLRETEQSGEQSK